MSVLKGIKTSKNATYTETVGGFTVHPSGVYPAKLNKAYVIESNDPESLSVAIMFKFTIMVNGVPHNLEKRATITNRAGETFSTDEKTGKQKQLAGYSLANSIALLATDCEANIEELDGDDFIHAGKDENGNEIQIHTKCFTELEDFDCQLAIVHVTKPKQEKQADGTWKDLPDETNTSNDIKYVFTEDGFSLNEELNYDEKNPQEEPEFIVDWEKKWKGVPVVYKYKGAPVRNARNPRGNAAAGNASGAVKRPSRFKRT